MLLVPDPDTAYIDPFTQHRTLNINCFVKDPVTGEMYTPRPALHREEGRAVPEADRHRGHQLLGTGGRVLHLRLDPVRPEPARGLLPHRFRRGRLELRRRAGRHEPRLPAALQGGLLPAARRWTSTRTCASEMVLNLEKVGIKIEVHHHEVGTAGQAEIDMRYDTLLKTADNVLKYKYVVKNTAWQAGKTVTFMPKPLFQDNGSGMHTHQSLWTDDENLFWDEVGLRAVSATWRATTSAACSRTRRRCWRSPTRRRTRTAGWCRATRRRSTWCTRQRNRAACVRIPVFSKTPAAKRLEFRTPDPTCNPYLAFSAMLMAGLDGDQEQDRAAGADRQGPVRPAARGGGDGQAGAGLARGGARRAGERPPVPAEGGVFTQDVIDTWIEYKRTHELDAVRLRPHPYEFHLYYDL